MRHIELLELLHPPDLLRQRPHQLVLAHIEHGELPEHPQLRREAGAEPVVHENDLVQRRRHVPDARRQAPPEAVAGEDDDGDRRVADVVGDLEPEPIVVEEDGVEGAVEELRRHRPLELVVPEV